MKQKKFQKTRDAVLLYCSDILACLFHYTGVNMLYGMLRRWSLSKPRRVVLMYHRVNEDHTDNCMAVNIRQFSDQMKYLVKHTRVLSLDEIIKQTHNKKEARKIQVAITFDDGYRDNYKNAYPILKELNLPATIFLVSGMVGKSKEILNEKEINEMRKHGISFGSHTVSHAVLSELNEKETEEELVMSRKQLEAILGEPIELLAYPKGQFNIATVKIAEKAGYRAAFTITPQDLKFDGNYTIGRIPMRACPMPVFKAKLSGFYHNVLSMIISKNV